MAAQAALAACRDAGFRVGVAVVDSLGQPRAVMVADGALGGHGYTGIRKALVVLTFGTPSSQAAARLTSAPAARALLTPAMMPWPGAVPISAGGRIVGAIGVSGASSLQDEACAASGAAAIGASKSVSAR